MTTEELDLFEKVVRNYVAEHDSEYNNGEGCLFAKTRGSCETCDLLKRAEHFLKERPRCSHGVVWPEDFCEVCLKEKFEQAKTLYLETLERAKRAEEKLAQLLANPLDERKLGTAAKVYKKQLEEVTAQLGRSQAKVEKLQAEHEEEKKRLLAAWTSSRAGDRRLLARAADLLCIGVCVCGPGLCRKCALREAIRANLSREEGR